MTEKAKDPKQKWLPGQAPKKIRSLHDAAAELLKARDKLRAAREGNNAAREHVSDLMRKNNLDSYAFGGLTITIEPHDTVKVQVGEATSEDEGEEATA